MFNSPAMFIWYSRGMLVVVGRSGLGLSEAGGMPADGWLEVLGHGDGGGSRKYP